MNNPKLQKSSRKLNLSLREKEALVNGILKRREKIQGDPTSASYSGQYEEAWDQVNQEVNAVNSSGIERTKDDLRKKYRNWKSDCKKKMGSNHKSIRLTNGKMDVSYLDSTDQLMAKLVAKE